MITQFALKNFKRFAKLELSMAPLTLLTGANGCGKSSAIQALLLANATEAGDGIVPLNGPYGLELGEALDVIHNAGEPLEFEVQVNLGGVEGHVVLRAPDDDSRYLEARPYGTARSSLGLRDNAIQLVYLGADRFGPRHVQDVWSKSRDELTVGNRGEFTAHVLDVQRRQLVEESRWHPDTLEAGRVGTFHSQVEMWMSSIVYPLYVDTHVIAHTNLTTLMIKSTERQSEWRKPANVGFGVSHVLPIVVAALAIPSGSIFVVENPESHLHPAGQSAMGRFLATIAASGAQVIVETHSDHVLSGVRRSVGVDSVLQPDDAAVYYFGEEAVEQLTFDDFGGLSWWPRGFFDQTETDLIELARAKHPQ